MTENKALFVKRFCKLIQENTMEYSDIKDITYRVADDGEEYIYVTYRSDAQRRIRVSADSCSAIMDDFLAKVNHAEWLLGDDRITPGPKDLSFFDELSSEYSEEDFTGYIGVLLDEHADEKDKEESMKFLEKIYLLAANYL